MRRILAVLLLCTSLVLAPMAATASVSGPCVRHYASPVTVQTITNGKSTLAASGSVSGCPGSSGSLTITVTALHYEGGAWVPKASASHRASWTSFTPGGTRARQSNATTPAFPCIIGQWETVLTGDDPYDYSANPVIAYVTMTGGDSGVCGSYGGGD